MSTLGIIAFVLIIILYFLDIIVISKDKGWWILLRWIAFLLIILFTNVNSIESTRKQTSIDILKGKSNRYEMQFIINKDSIVIDTIYIKK